MSDKILVPIDLDHQSSWKDTLPIAFEKAQQSDDVAVTVMTVVPDLITGIDWRYAIRGEMHGSEEYDMCSLVEAAEEKVQEIVREHAPAGVTVETLARHGVIYEQILNVADEIGATEIIMAAHRPSLKDYLIGPNTDRCVRHAKCTVTVVRRD